MGSGGTSTRNVNAILAGTFGFGGNGFAGNSYHAGSGGGLSGIFSGTNITSASSASAILVAGGGGGAGASAYGSIQRSVATSGGGSTVVSVRSTYATGTVVVSAPTSSAGGWGASGMRGGNALNTGTNIDGRGGGGGGYRGGGAVQTAVTSGATVNTATAGTGGIGFADSNLVRNATLYSGGATLTTYYVPGLNTDADRGGAGNGGSESAVTLSPGNGANGKIILI